MLVCFWSLKGGSGCSVTAALAALAAVGRRDTAGDPPTTAGGPASRRQLRVASLPLSPTSAATTGGVTLVDLEGDLAAVLGAAAHDGPGVADWLRAGDDAPPDALRAVGRSVAPGLSLVGPGTGEFPGVDPTDRQLDALDGCDDLVVVDAGCVFRSDAVGDLARTFAAQATRSVLVTRPCYLSLRRASGAVVVPSAIVVLDEVGRALGRREIEEVVGAPVVACITVDPAIARSVDAGLLMSRVPRGVARALEVVA